MAKSAGKLYVSQPAVSKAITELERMLGVRLLDRTAKGVEPNMYGRALLKCATAVFDEIDQGLKEVQSLADPTSGEVRIGPTDPMIVGLVPAILERLHRTHPNIRVHVRHIGSVDQSLRELRERNIDLGLGRLEPAEDDIDVQTLFDDATVVVAGAHNAWTRRRGIVLADLSAEPWVLPPPDTLIGRLISEAFKAGGLAVPSAHVLTQVIQLNATLLAKGPYLSICPASMLHFSAARLKLKKVPIRLAIPLWPTGMVTLKGRTISAATRVFMDCAREVSAPLARRLRSGEL
jgi:DNA-binding transcriptional LysR family regulator